jgi:hypothetical protein
MSGKVQNIICTRISYLYNNDTIPVKTLNINIFKKNINNMNKILQKILQSMSNILTFFNNFIKKLETKLAADKLILIRTSHNSLGKNITFLLSNHKLLDHTELFFQIYMFLMTSKEFLEFGEYKIIIVNAKIKKVTFNLHPNVLIKNDTSFKAY